MKLGHRQWDLPRLCRSVACRSMDAQAFSILTKDNTPAVCVDASIMTPDVFLFLSINLAFPSITIINYKSLLEPWAVP